MPPRHTPCFSSCSPRIRFMLISLSSHTHKHTQRNEYEFECVLPQTFRQSANTTRNARVFHLKLCLQQQKQQLLKALSEDAHLLKRNQLIFILYCANGNRKAVALKAIWSAPFEYPGGSESIVTWMMIRLWTWTMDFLTLLRNLTQQLGIC